MPEAGESAAGSTGAAGRIPGLVPPGAAAALAAPLSTSITFAAKATMISTTSAVAAGTSSCVESQYRIAATLSRRTSGTAMIP